MCTFLPKAQAEIFLCNTHIQTVIQRPDQLFRTMIFASMCPCSAECNCRCGESIYFLGAFVFVAAIAFLLIGWTFQVVAPYGPDWTGWYHPLNLWFFKLGVVLMVVGIVYAILTRRTKAFAREPLIQVGDEENGAKNKEETSPTPYVMLPA